MSVWRNLLRALLPWAFKTGEAAATAAVENQDAGKAAADAVAGIEKDKALQDAAEAVVTETVKKVGKKK